MGLSKEAKEGLFCLLDEVGECPESEHIQIQNGIINRLVGKMSVLQMVVIAILSISVISSITIVTLIIKYSSK